MMNLVLVNRALPLWLVGHGPKFSIPSFGEALPTTFVEVFEAIGTILVQGLTSAVSLLFNSATGTFTILGWVALLSISAAIVWGFVNLIIRLVGGIKRK